MKMRGGKTAGEQQSSVSCPCALSPGPALCLYPVLRVKPEASVAGSKESGLGKPHRPPSESLTITLNICFAFHEGVVFHP